MTKAIDRLRVFLALYHPAVKFKDVRLHYERGKIKAAGQIIEIKSAGYPARIDGKWVSVYRLWNELHEHFSEHVEVVKEKNTHPTRITWGGRIYSLNQQLTHKKEVKKDVQQYKAERKDRRDADRARKRESRVGATNSRSGAVKRKEHQSTADRPANSQARGSRGGIPRGSGNAKPYQTARSANR